MAIKPPTSGTRGAPSSKSIGRRPHTLKFQKGIKGSVASRKSGKFDLQKKSFPAKKSAPDLPDNRSASKLRKDTKRELFQRRNANADFITQCNALYADLLSAHRGDPSSLPTKVDAVYKFVSKSASAGKSETFGMKAKLLPVNRLLQMSYKYGTKEQRSRLTDVLEGEFLKLAEGAKSYHLCLKILHYVGDGKKEELATKRILQKGGVDFLYSKVASRVAVQAYVTSSPSIQTRFVALLGVPPAVAVQDPEALKRSLQDTYSMAEEGGRSRKLMKEHVEAAIQRAVDKELIGRMYFHPLINFYASILSEEELSSLLVMLQECLSLLLASKDGAQVLVKLLHVADAKSRKKFISSWKDGGVDPYAVATNAVSMPVLLKLLAVVDDTRLLRESLLGPMMGFDFKTPDSIKPKVEAADGSADVSQIVSLSQDKVGRKCLLQVIAENPSSYLSAEELCLIKASSPTSKKDGGTRKKELQSVVLPALSIALKQRMEAGDASFRDSWVNHLQAKDVLIEYLKTTRDVSITTLLAAFFESLVNSGESAAVLDHSIGQRFLTTTLRIGVAGGSLSDTKVQLKQSIEEAEPLRDEQGVTIADRFSNAILAIEDGEELAGKFMQTKGVFVLLELLRIAGGREDTQNNLSMRCRNILKSSKELSQSHSPGIELLRSRVAIILGEGSSDSPQCNKRTSSSPLPQKKRQRGSS